MIWDLIRSQSPFKVEQVNRELVWMIIEQQDSYPIKDYLLLRWFFTQILFSLVDNVFVFNFCI
jgi:hypothetical protein